MVKALRSLLNVVGVGGSAVAASYAHLEWLAAVVVCALVLVMVVAGLVAVCDADPKRRGDAYRVLVVILPVIRRSAVRPDESNHSSADDARAGVGPPPARAPLERASPGCATRIGDDSVSPY